MATAFPASLDDFTNPASGDLEDGSTDANLGHAKQHSDKNDATEALEAKVGIGSSNQSPVASRILGADGTGTSSWRQLATADIQDGAVTFAKLAAAALVTNRQGGSATDWTTIGTTNQTVGQVRIQIGSSVGDAGAAKAVTFPVAFSQKPVIFLCPHTNEQTVIGVLANGSTSTTGFAFDVLSTAGARQALDCFWIAIGTV